MFQQLDLELDGLGVCATRGTVMAVRGKVIKVLQERELKMEIESYVTRRGMVSVVTGRGNSRVHVTPSDFYLRAESETVLHCEFFVLDEDSGKEYVFHLEDPKISMREGHDVSIGWADMQSQQGSIYFYLRNHDLDQEWYDSSVVEVKRKLTGFELFSIGMKSVGGIFALLSIIGGLIWGRDMLESGALVWQWLWQAAFGTLLILLPGICSVILAKLKLLPRHNPDHPVWIVICLGLILGSAGVFSANPALWAQLLDDYPGFFRWVMAPLAPIVVLALVQGLAAASRPVKKWQQHAAAAEEKFREAVSWRDTVLARVRDSVAVG